MEQQGVDLPDQRKLCCSVCLDLLKDPVTIPCGHTYCMSCIQTQWDLEDQKDVHSCPQCRQSFTPRPILVRKTMLVDLVEELKKRQRQDASPSGSPAGAHSPEAAGSPAAPGSTAGAGTAAVAGSPAVAGSSYVDGDHCYAGPEDVSCDFCTDKKLRAVKSCLQCLVSYCHKHLQPHYDVLQLKKHKLVKPLQKLQDHICPRHDELMKMFCRTDQQCICYLCTVDKHVGHDTVTLAAERAEKQMELEVSRQKIQQRIKCKEKDMTKLQQEADAINRYADVTLKNSEGIFTEMIRVVEKRRHNVEQQVRSKEKMELCRVKQLRSKLALEIAELRRKDTKLDGLSHIDDHNQFLLQYPSLSKLREEDPGSVPIKSHPLNYFEDLTVAVSEFGKKLQAGQRPASIAAPRTLTKTQVLTMTMSPFGPLTRDNFLQYLNIVTLDSNTVNVELSLSEGNKRVTVVGKKQKYLDHPFRFSHWQQVLSKESLRETGPCYWEVEWSGWSGSAVAVAVAQQDIKRKGNSNQCKFGFNDRSWALYCTNSGYGFYHNGIRFPVLGPVSSTIGVYLDQAAGTLCFYSVSATMTILHRVQTTFKRSLCAGIWLTSTGATARVS